MGGSGESAGFRWRRPKDVATSIFLGFAAEAEASVGDAGLLADIDAAMNTPLRMPSCLALDEGAAKALAAASGADERAYLAHLAFLHEIEWRKSRGPALWERKAGYAPCPDFLPPTKGQIPARLFGLHRALLKVWNLALIIVVSGVFPFVILPACGMLIFGGKSFFGHSALGVVARTAFGVWCCALASFVSSILLCRFVRSRGRAGRRQQRGA